MRQQQLLLAALVAAALPSAAAAQRVIADVRIGSGSGSGPVAGHIIVGDPDAWYPRTAIEVAPRYHARPIYRDVRVYRMGRGHNGGWRSRGYRAVRMWYDADRDCYYDRDDPYRDGLREVVIYERGGRYYDQEFGRRAGHDREWRHGDRDRDDGDHDRD
jgi:hypothetical protein